MICAKTRLPLACTAAVTGRHAATCSSVCSPGVPGFDCPTRLDAVGQDQAADFVAVEERSHVKLLRKDAPAPDVPLR
jgi:hypothetical protein